MARHDCDLIVVGLGPVGAVLAGLARLQGLSVIAVDAHDAPFPLPRAAVFDHEIMRIFQALGVAETIAPLCRAPDRYQFLTADGRVLLDFPLAPQGVFGWAETYALHQPAVEAALRARLVELGIDLRLGTAFHGLAADDAGVAVTIARGGVESVLRARYVVGCDGANSAVRAALGITLDDLDFDEPWLVLDTIIDDPAGLPLVCQQICDPARPVTHMAMSHNRFRWEFMLKPDETAEAMLAEDRIAALLAPWDCADRITVERKAIYRFHALIAQEWRRGRVLLAGDAAHQMPPFAGQGMCSGIRDAANLAWKLAIAVRDDAPPALLESYQAEREPHVRAIIGTAIAMGRVVCLLDPAAAAARDRDMLARKASGAQDVSIAYPDLAGGLLMTTPRAGALFPQPVAASGARFDAILPRGPVLIGRHVAAAAHGDITAIDIDDPALAPFRTAVVAWLAETDAPAVLIRPDRHVFGIGRADALAGEWRRQVGMRALPVQ